LTVIQCWLAYQQSRTKTKNAGRPFFSAREFRATSCAGVTNKVTKRMQDYIIERAGIANLDFTGELIGQSAGPIPRVKIYRTKDLKYIGEMGGNQKLVQAQNFDKPADVITWFKSLNYGSVSPEVQDAIEDAAKHDEAFNTIWNVHVS